MISGRIVGDNETMRLLPDCSRLFQCGELRLRVVPVVIAALVATSTTISCAASQSSSRETPLVYAAASLADVAGDIAESYREASGNSVRFTFGGSSQAASHIIDGGAPVDAVWFAGWTPMSRLVDAGLVVVNSVAQVCSNKVVVVAAGTETEVAITDLRDLVGAGKVAVPDPDASPAGEYAKAMLEVEGVWADLRGQVVPTLDVRAALSAVTAGVAKFAVVYETDALTEDVQVVLEPGVPSGSEPPTYFAVTVSESEVAEGFVGYLTSSPARAILEGHGFLLVDSAP